MNIDRFKFRYFCKTTKFMGEVISLNINDNYALVKFEYADKYSPDEEVEISDGVLMQCTGLKDMNGKLIYEGDIIERNVIINKEHYLQKGVVVFKQNKFCFESSVAIYHFSENMQEYKIIDNFYQI